MIGRSLTALAAALAAGLCCVAGSFLHAMRLVAHVDGVSLSAVLTSHWNAAFTAWRSSLTIGDRVLFAAVAVLAAAAVLSAPYLKPTFGRIRTRVTGARRLPHV